MGSKGYTLKNIYVPEKYAWVLAAVEELARREDRSFSNMLIRLLVEALEARGIVQREGGVSWTSNKSF